MRAAPRPTRIALAALVAACTATTLLIAEAPASAAPSGAGTAHSSGVVDGETYDRFIVHFVDGTAADRDDSAARAELAAAGRSAGHRLDFARRLGTSGVVLTVPERLDAAGTRGLLQRVAAHPGVEAVEPDARMRSQASPQDPAYTQQWHYREAHAGMNLPAAWDVATGATTIVAVLDTGITAHPDLDANVIAGYDFLSDPWMARDENGYDANPSDEGDWAAAGECGRGSAASNSSWHGTHVAGTVAAVNNTVGGVGVAYSAKVQPVRVLGRCGGYLSDIADGILWASGGTGALTNPAPADVINMSLGGGGACATTYQTAIDTAVARGTTVVVAAGNSTANAANYQPASCAKTVVVGASDREGNSAYYSNYGPAVDLTAPGGETATTANGVYSTLNSGKQGPGDPGYAYYQGTSMATPHVAGLAALLLSRDASLTPRGVEYTLKAGVRKLPGTCNQNSCGTGLSDAAAALAVTGVPLQDDYTVNGPVTLADRSTTLSPQTITDRAGPATSALKVGLSITHPRRGDLKIDLVGPQGAVFALKSASKNDRVANVNTTYTVNATAQTANGTWTLRITDSYSGSTGTLNGWTLTF